MVTVARSETAEGRTGTARPAAPTRRVRLPWLAAAGALAVAVTLLVLWGFGRVADRREVVMVTAPVARGEPIPASSLGSSMVAVDSSATELFSIGQRDELVGKVAAADLHSGDLLGPSLVAAAPPLPDGSVQVGAVVRAGRFPVSVAAGDRVLAVPVDGDPVAAVEVRVVSSSATASDRSLSVVLAAAPGDGVRVGQWAAADKLVLVLIGPVT